MSTKKIVILGGGFAGVYTALHLQRMLKHEDSVSITLINNENYLLFTPMLHEVAASDLDANDIVNPIRKMLQKAQFFCGSVDTVNLEERTVTVSHGDMHHSHILDFDYLVLALGSKTHFFNMDQLEEHAVTMRSLGDAIHLRNQVISLLEEADFECCKEIRQRLLTFVVAGGGFAGVETAAAIQDFIMDILPYYPNLTQKDIRIMLVHSGKRLLPELSASLGQYTEKLLHSRGVEILLQTRVNDYDGDLVTLSDGASTRTATLIWTAGSTAHPIVESLNCSKEKGKILVNSSLQLKEYPNVFALGDCAAIPDGNDTFHPPTAQHAIREARTAARNITALLRGKKLEKFRFRTLGQLASLGHHTGVAEVLGFKFSGLFAWFLWRTIYLMKLPRMEKRIRVALSWTLDLFFAKDNVQLPTARNRNKNQLTVTVQEDLSDGVVGGIHVSHFSGNSTHRMPV